MQQQHVTAERRVKKTRSCGREKVVVKQFFFSIVLWLGCSKGRLGKAASAEGTGGG